MSNHLPIKNTPERKVLQLPILSAALRLRTTCLLGFDSYPGQPPQRVILWLGLEIPRPQVAWESLNRLQSFRNVCREIKSWRKPQRPVLLVVFQRFRPGDNMAAPTPQSTQGGVYPQYRRTPQGLSVMIGLSKDKWKSADSDFLLVVRLGQRWRGNRMKPGGWGSRTGFFYINGWIVLPCHSVFFGLTPNSSENTQLTTIQPSYFFVFIFISFGLRHCHCRRHRHYDEIHNQRGRASERELILDM